MIKIKNYEIGQDVETGEEVISFICKIQGTKSIELLFNARNNVYEKPYTDLGKELISAINLATNSGD